MSPRPTNCDEVSGGGWLFITIAMPIDLAICYAMVVFHFEDRLHHDYYSYEYECVDLE
jgi:hypothetical protein